MKINIPRVLITAEKSGAGKTVITCGILQVLKRRGLKITAYKCGPDYIDPMFHREVLGIPSYNLDTFLCGRKMVQEILIRHSMPEKQISGGQLSVIEGVMGYYDGLGGITHEASTYDVAVATNTPSVLVVDGKGASVSMIPSIQGFLNYQDKRSKNSHIQGVILNRVSPVLYERLKGMIEEETSVRVYGYVPEIKGGLLESRYLGLKMPKETGEIEKRLEELGDILEKSLDIDGLIKLAETALPFRQKGIGKTGKDSIRQCVRVGVASDEAFSFIYQDNLDTLEEMGAQIVPFSPLHDTDFFDELDGVVLYGGYPELYAEKLSENKSMRDQIRQKILEGMPCIAECGGFMYLTESIRNERGDIYPMCGALAGESFHTPALKRFGYVRLCKGKVFGKDVGDIFAHEFHYYDSKHCGESFEARKPMSDRTFRCMISTDTILAGFPHIHYAGSPKVAEAFIEVCGDYQRKKKGKGRGR